MLSKLDSWTHLLDCCRVLREGLAHVQVVPLAMHHAEDLCLGYLTYCDTHTPTTHKYIYRKINLTLYTRSQTQHTRTPTLRSGISIKELTISLSAVSINMAKKFFVSSLMPNFWKESFICCFRARFTNQSYVSTGRQIEKSFRINRSCLHGRVLPVIESLLNGGK